MWLRRLCAATAVLCGVGSAFTASATDADPVVFKIATVGDSRQDAKDPRLTSHDVLWLQNTKVLSRMVRDIAADHDQVLVFNGDMIMGYQPDPAILGRQYGYWRGIVATLMEAGTYVLPVSGNHEIQRKIESDPSSSATSSKKAKRVASQEMEEAYRFHIGDLVLDLDLWKNLTQRAAVAFDPDNAPVIGGPDGAVTDQRKLTYSFDAGDVHIAVLATDSVGHNAEVPLVWLAQDLAAAQTRGAKHIFVFGHKPAFHYYFSPEITEIFDAPEDIIQNGEKFWDVIEQYHATYFCGHEHIYHAEQPRKAQGGQAWQIMVGSGGSPLSALPHYKTLYHPATDRAYVWAEVNVHESGKVTVLSKGFDDRFAPTQIYETLDITP